jgi:hypothetical protein
VDARHKAGHDDGGVRNSFRGDDGESDRHDR